MLLILLLMIMMTTINNDDGSDDGGRMFNPKRTGGVESTPLYVSRDNLMLLFFAHRAFVTFFFRVLRTFDAIFVKIGRTVPKLCNVMQSSVGSKYWNFLDLCTKHMENGFLC